MVWGTFKGDKGKKNGFWEGAEHHSERNADFNLIPYPLQQRICMLWSLSLHQHPEAQKGFDEQPTAYSQNEQEIIVYISKAT